MKKTILFLFSLSLLLINIKSATSQTDKYRLTYRDDPSTTVVIGWSGSDATVYYDTIDHGTSWNLYSFNHGVDRTVNHRGMDNRFSRLSGLKAKKKYFFVVKSASGVSNKMYFKTITDEWNTNDTVSFISGGDTRTGAITEFDYQNCRTKRQDGNKLVSKLRPYFVSFSGDFILNLPIISNANQEWQDWLNDWQLTISSDGQIYPCIFAYGNHEDNNDIYNLFDVPNAEVYYSLAFGGNLFRLYSLNTEKDGCTDVQTTWLTNDLSLHSDNINQPYWKLVQYHVPMVSHGEYSPRNDLIDCLAPKFKDYKVNLAMESHVHVVKWTWPIVPSTAAGSEKGFIRDDNNGTVYIGEGTWGAPLRDTYTPNSWTRDQGKFNSFFLVCVSKQKINIKNIKFEDVPYVIEEPADGPCCKVPVDVILWTPANGSEVVLNKPNIQSVNEIIPIKEALVYPNPAINEVNIEIPNNNIDRRIDIINAYGHLRSSFTFNKNENKKKISLKLLAKGTYFLYIHNKDNFEIHKLIVQ